MKPILLAFSLVLLGACSGDGPVPPKVPFIEPPPEPPFESVLTPFAGKYRVVEVEGEPVEAGPVLWVISEPQRLGVVLGPEDLTTSPEESTFEPDGNRLMQNFYRGETHWTVLLEQSEDRLLLETYECPPGTCVARFFAAVKSE